MVMQQKARTSDSLDQSNYVVLSRDIYEFIFNNEGPIKKSNIPELRQSKKFIGHCG